MEDAFRPRAEGEGRLGHGGVHAGVGAQREGVADRAVRERFQRVLVLGRVESGHVDAGLSTFRVGTGDGQHVEALVLRSVSGHVDQVGFLLVFAGGLVLHVDDTGGGAVQSDVHCGATLAVVLVDGGGLVVPFDGGLGAVAQGDVVAVGLVLVVERELVVGGGVLAAVLFEAAVAFDGDLLADHVRERRGRLERGLVALGGAVVFALAGHADDAELVGRGAGLLGDLGDDGEVPVASGHAHVAGQCVHRVVFEGEGSVLVDGERLGGLVDGARPRVVADGLDVHFHGPFGLRAVLVDADRAGRLAGAGDGDPVAFRVGRAGRLAPCDREFGAVAQGDVLTVGLVLEVERGVLGRGLAALELRATISLGAKKFGTDLGMKAPAKRSTKHKIMAPTFPKALFTFLDFCISISLTICAITVLLVFIAYSFNVNIETSSFLNRKI